jgi:hypothetical protein
VRKFAHGVAVAALLALPTSAFSQTFQIGPGGVQVNPDRPYAQAGGHECRELRLACIHRDELGEQGQGNCERYRRLCGQR